MKHSALCIALLPLFSAPVFSADAPGSVGLESRAAQGDITAPGGARRLSGDQTEALRASISERPA
ncbi:alkaline phosphatase, partial [Enterobacter hormaechei]|nr:alkaline phosphatase [Enterobacter hormaechei]